MFNKTLYKDLNKNQKGIIDYLQKNIKNSLNTSIQEVAKKCGCSSSYITKTLKKIGFFGWKDYRAFAMSQLTIPKSHSNYSKYIEKTLFSSILYSLSHIDEMQISQISEKIIKNTNNFLYFIGEGFSYYISLDQKRRYSKLGIKAYAHDSTNYEYNSITSKDIVIMISASGYSKSLEDLYTFLKNKKVQNVLVTVNPSISSKFENTILGAFYDGEQMNEREIPRISRIIILIILDWIFIKVKKRLEKK